MDDIFYVSYDTVHKLVKSLAEKIKALNFDPDIIVAIGSGGFVPARILKTFINRPIFAVGISYYGIDQKHRTHPTKIQWINEAEENLTGKKVLLIDEVDDSRVTLSYCVAELLNYKPKEIAVLVLHNKKKRKDASLPKDIKIYIPAIETGDVWIKYPWDADDILQHEENEKKMLSRLSEEKKKEIFNGII